MVVARFLATRYHCAAQISLIYLSIKRCHLLGNMYLPMLNTPCVAQEPITSQKRFASGKASKPGLPDLSLLNIPKWGKIYEIATKLPNGHEMYQMAVIYSK
jgi:hypothetical protein